MPLRSAGSLRDPGGKWLTHVFEAEKEGIEDEKTSRKDEDEGTNIRIALVSRTRLLFLGFPLYVTHLRFIASDSECSIATLSGANYSL